MWAVLYLLGTWPRRRWIALAGVAVLGAMSLGSVVLAGLGGHRSATAWENLRQRARDGDTILDVTSLDAARRAAAGARETEGVAEALAMALGRLFPEDRPDSSYVILPLEPGGVERLWQPVVTAGRLADQGRADEVWSTRRSRRPPGWASATGSPSSTRSDWSLSQ